MLNRKHLMFKYLFPEKVKINSKRPKAAHEQTVPGLAKRTDSCVYYSYR